MHLVIVNEPVSLVASDEVVVVEKELHPVQKEPVHSVVNHLQKRDLVARDVKVQATCFVRVRISGRCRFHISGEGEKKGKQLEKRILFID